MKKEIQKMILLLGVITLCACGKTEFTNVESSVSAKTDIPLDPVDPVVPVVPVTPVYSAKVSSGACAQDSSTNVLSCLKCDVPQIQQAPQLSAKAQALVDSMFLACQISNKSDRNNFRPTKEMLVKKLNRGSQALYPETARTAQMSLVIAGLTNQADDSLRQKMFGGLWYQPPYSDAFETYFGLTVQEAKSTLCWDGNVSTPAITGVSGLYSKQWLDCQYGNDPFNCKERPDYVLALGYRSQLENVLSKSISQPYLAPIPDPEKKCSWDKFEGTDIVAAKIQLKKWQAEGRQLSMEIVKPGGAGVCGAVNESDIAVGSTISIASYICQ